MNELAHNNGCDCFLFFTPVAEEYEKAKRSAQPEDILRAVNAEEQVYFQLLTEHHDDCTLFFCRSDGSPIEVVLDELMDQKTEQRVEFFSHIYGKEPNADAIRFLMDSQLRYLSQLLDKRMEKDRMLACIRLHTDAAVTPAAKPVCTLHHVAQGFLIKNTQSAPGASTKQLRSSQSFRKNEIFTPTGS